MKRQAAVGWSLVKDDLDLDQLITASRKAWDSDGYAATYVAWAVTAMIASRVAPLEHGYVNALQPAEPPAETLARIGGGLRGLQVAKDTWAVVASVGVSDVLGVNDPMIKTELRTLSTAYKGSGVYMLSWWSRSLLDYVRSTGSVDLKALEADVIHNLAEL